MTAADRIKAFFKRDEYVGTYSRPPLWHRYASHETVTLPLEPGRQFPERRLIVTALCGYKHSVISVLTGDGVGFTAVDWKAEVKTKKLRCAKCDAKAAASAP